MDTKRHGLAVEFHAQNFRAQLTAGLKIDDAGRVAVTFTSSLIPSASLNNANPARGPLHVPNPKESIGGCVRFESEVPLLRLPAARTCRAHWADHIAADQI